MGHWPEKTAECYFMKVKDGSSQDFTGFDTQAAFTDGAHPDLDILGFAIRDFDMDDAEFTILSVDGGSFLDFVNFEATDVIMEPGNTYVIMMNYTGNSSTLFHGYNEVITQSGQISSVLFNSTWFLGGFSGSPTAVLRVQLEMVTSVDHNPLPDNAVDVYPNPTNSQFNVELNLSEAVNTTVTLADINGKVIQTNDYEKVQTEKYPINVSDLPAGTYIIRVATEIGTSTRKVVVQ